MEVTGPQMVLTMKLTTFAWNVYDGRRKVEVRPRTFVFHERHSAQNSTQDLDKWQAAKRITKYPSLLEFLGYSLVLLLLAIFSCLMYIVRFYYPGILVGPYLDFAEYMELINETTFQNALVKAKVKAGRRLPPGRKRAAYTKMFLGLVYLGAFVFYGGKYNYQVALKPEFMKNSLLKRYVFLFICEGFRACK